MTTTAQDSTPKPVFRSFDADRRAQVLALVALGCSRSLAAELAGCCHTTIGRAALRDPDFAAKLTEAESHVDVKALTRINEAAEENKNWRAAAWILERRHPEEFGRRAPHAFDDKQIMALLARIFSFTMPRLPLDQRKQFLDDFNLTMKEVEANLRQPDQWRKVAEQQRRWRTYSEKGPAEEFRSPYDHPQWEEPKSYEQLVAESPDDHEKFGQWLRGLSLMDFRTAYDGLSQWRAAWQVEAPQLCLAAKEIKRQMNEECVAQATECPPGGSAIAEPPEPTSQLQPNAEPPASHDVPPVPEQLQQSAAIEDAAPAESTPEPVGPAVEAKSPSGRPVPFLPTREPRQSLTEQPLQEHAESGLLPTVNLVPQTPAEHRAYQEWAARQYVILRHNLLMAQGLPQQPAAAPRTENFASRAYEERLKAWTEAMSR